MKTGPSLTTSHGAIALLPQLVYRALQYASWARAQTRTRVRIVERYEEKGDVVLPWYPAEGGEIRYGDQVAVSVLFIRDAELTEVGLVVHVPAEDDTTEAEAFLGNGEELLLRHELPAQDAIDIDSRNLHGVIVLEQLGEALGGDLFGVGHLGGGGGG